MSTPPASSPPALVRRFTLQFAAWTDSVALSHSPSFGPRITPRYNGQHFSLGLQLAGLFETAQQSTAYPEADVASGVVLLAPEVCFRADLVAWTLSPCAQLELGATWLRTSGIESPSQARDLWFAVGGEARAQWWVHPRWSLDLGVGLSVPLRRPTFTIDTQGGAVPLHRASSAGLRVSVGVTYAAWP